MILKSFVYFWLKINYFLDFLHKFLPNTWFKLRTFYDLIAKFSAQNLINFEPFFICCLGFCPKFCLQWWFSITLLDTFELKIILISTVFLIRYTLFYPISDLQWQFMTVRSKFLSSTITVTFFCFLLPIFLPNWMIFCNFVSFIWAQILNYMELFCESDLLNQLLKISSRNFESKMRFIVTFFLIYYWSFRPQSCLQRWISILLWNNFQLNFWLTIFLSVS